jgi:alpha-methylacyl-CoA racemase
MLTARVHGYNPRFATRSGVSGSLPANFDSLTLASMTQGPLSGIRVVELASLAPAPFGCMLLADLGADVLRVERTTSTLFDSGPGGPLNRGKRSVSADLKTPEGAAAVKRLVRNADVLVEGFRPGVMERLGLGPDELLAINPGLIYARMTGWGQEGPLANTAGHDINYISIAGALEPLGRADERPHPPINLLGDFAGGGTFMALGILAALLERGTSGQGQVVDAAMVDGTATLTMFLHSMRAAGLWSTRRGTNLLDGGASFYETYKTSDGLFMAVGAIEPQFYGALLRGLGLAVPDDHVQLDPAEWPKERERFEAAFSEKTRAEWTTIFADLDACVTPVLSPWEAHLHPHNAARDSFVEVDGVVQPAPSPRFSRSAPATPTAMDAGGRDPQRTLAAWGLEPGEITALLENGAIA